MSKSYAQDCKKDSIYNSLPNERFEILGNGSEVKDKVTGLIWQRCSIGKTWNGMTCTGTATTHTWQQALTVAKNLGGGYRLPNIKELQSIIEYQCVYPTTNITIFPDTTITSSGRFWKYWSSSIVMYNGTKRGINFGDGRGFFEDNIHKNLVRAVRSE